MIDDKQVVEMNMEAKRQHLHVSKLKIKKAYEHSNGRLYHSNCNTFMFDFHISCSIHECDNDLCLTCCLEIREQPLQEFGKRKAASRDEVQDNYLYCPCASDIQCEDLKHFQRHWIKGEPIIVSNSLKDAIGLRRDPLVMKRACRIYSSSPGYSKPAYQITSEMYEDRHGAKDIYCLWCCPRAWIGDSATKLHCDMSDVMNVLT
ncbi:hypothetical protein QYF36_016127 [Acer negundo]|nr:hypothetical protein QYF36_016127 [Acer negundo]